MGCTFASARCISEAATSAVPSAITRQPNNAREFEETHHPENQHHPQISGEHHRKPERQHRDEIDDAGWAQHIFEPRLCRGQMLMWAMLDSGPKPQSIFDRKNHEREKFDEGKGGAVTLFILRYRFERDRDQIDKDQDDQKPVDPLAHAVAHRTLFKDLMNTSAHVLEAVACHIPVTLS
jgi:hypothetical protein